MLRGQMLLRQFKSVQDSPMNLCLKFRQNRVSNSWDITDIEFVWVVGVQSHFRVKPNFRWIVVELTLSWGFDNYLILRGNIIKADKDWHETIKKLPAEKSEIDILDKKVQGDVFIFNHVEN